jgi:hypothetical protein
LLVDVSTTPPDCGLLIDTMLILVPIKRYKQLSIQSNWISQCADLSRLPFTLGGVFLVTKEARATLIFDS